MKFYIVLRHLIHSHSYPVYAMSLNHISTIIKHAENRIELVCVCFNSSGLKYHNGIKDCNQQTVI